MDVLVNQLGYETTRPKRAVVRTDDEATVGTVTVVDRDRGSPVYETNATRVGPVANWDAGGDGSRDVYWTVDVSGVAGSGEFELEVDVAIGGEGDDERGRGRSDDDGVDGARTIRSRPFLIDDHVVQEQALSDVLWHFRTQRPSGAFDRADRAVPFVGDREGTVDVRGGWYDASGDVSKYLSHLHYANVMNPQHVPMVVWGLLDGRDLLAANETGLAEDLGHRIVEEAVHGADFLVRACDPEGYFYTTVFDGWSHDPDQREICAFEGFDGEKTDDYQAGLRQGGGMSIAALARASRLDSGGGFGEDGPIGTGGAFGTDDYLETAIRAFDHLAEHNETYLDDGTENVIDDYCGLLAATELAHATGEARFRTAASDRARSLLDRQTGDDRYDGWFRADEDGERPFFHAAEEGLPIVALHRYLTALGDQTTGADLDDPTLEADVRAAIERYWRFQVAITDDVTNPFGYPRQYVKATDEDDPRPAFFMPHANETGYWWQGENARVASIAAAAFRSREVIEDSTLEARLTDLGHDAVDWILGRNPFGVSMVNGVGTPEPDYHPKYRNAPGGVINGITAAVDDPEGIAFCPEPQATDLAMRWRWAEQWIVHAAWFFLALCSTDRI